MASTNAYLAFGTVLLESPEFTFNIPDNETFGDYIARQAGLIPPDVLDVRAMIAYADAKDKAVQDYPFEILVNGNEQDEMTNNLLVLKSSVIKSTDLFLVGVDVDALKVSPEEEAMFQALCSRLSVSDPQWTLFAHYA